MCDTCHVTATRNSNASLFELVKFLSVHLLVVMIDHFKGTLLQILWKKRLIIFIYRNVFMGDFEQLA